MITQYIEAIIQDARANPDVPVELFAKMIEWQANPGCIGQFMRTEELARCIANGTHTKESGGAYYVTKNGDIGPGVTLNVDSVRRNAPYYPIVKWFPHHS